MDESLDSGGLGIGTEIDGRYRIDAELGSGGVGAVYRATHLKLDRPVALKVIREQLCSNRALRLRFEREARALAALSHPHVVTVTDYGFHDSVPYLVMELLDGQTLDQRLGEGPLGPDEALEILSELLLALTFVHDQGLVHRDLKPGNVFLQSVPGAGPHVKVLDFGLAKFMDPAEGDNAVTRAGEVFGTPSYMAPEQVSGDPIDGRTDLYAAGVLFFEMLSGRPPFHGSMASVMSQHLAKPLPKIEDVNPARVATSELDAFIRRATEKKREGRFGSAAEMAAALEALPRPLLERDEEGDEFFERKTAARMEDAPVEDSMLAASSRTPKKTRGRAVWALLAVLGGTGAFAFFFFLGRAEPSPVGQQTAARPTPAVSTSPPVAPRGAESSAEPSVADGSVLPSVDSAAPAADSAAAPPASAKGDAPSVAAGERIWADAPKLLLATRDAVDAGTPLSKRSVTYVHGYNRKHAGDPRGHMILARSHLNRGWKKDALNEYAGALKLNPRVRKDPRIIDDLLTLVAQGWRAASDLVEREYGEMAVPAIEARLKTVGVDRLAETRLTSLRERLLSEGDDSRR